jgi:hypothetical protein
MTKHVIHLMSLVPERTSDAMQLTAVATAPASNACLETSNPRLFSSFGKRVSALPIHLS